MGASLLDSLLVTPEPTFDLSQIGPATRIAIRTFLRAYDRETRLLAERLSFRRVTGAERRHYERELQGWHDTRREILTRSYQPPYVPGSGLRERAGHSEVNA